MPRSYYRPPTYHDQPPSYDDFIRTSEQYPPLLFIRAAKRHSEPCNTFHRTQHTTSFGGNLSKPRAIPNAGLHHLVHVERPEEPPIFSEPGCSFGRSNTEWSFPESFPRNSPVGSLKKTASLDSVFSRDSDKDCHFQLSITHSISPPSCCAPVKYRSLPTRFKISEPKPNHIDITFLTTLPDGLCKRKYSSCLICQDSRMKSEIRTTLKARCYSDPCKRVSLYYSLSH